MKTIVWYVVIFATIFFEAEIAQGFTVYQTEGEQVTFTDYKFSKIDIAQGLSQSTVYVIFQDSRGFIWVGTRDGLNRFDGYDFLHFRADQSSPQHLQNPRVRTIFEDNSERLWIGTDGGGIDILDLETHTIQPVTEVAEKNVLTLLKLNSDNILAGTRSSGLLMIDKASKTIIPHPVLKNVGTIWSLYNHPKHGVMAGTDTGLWLIDDEPVQLMADKVVKSIQTENADSIWVGTDTRGLFRVDLQNTDNREQLIENRQILALHSDRQDNLWVGTGSNGIKKLLNNGDQLRFLENPLDFNSISDSSIRSIGSDRSGMIWIGTNNGGISTYSEYRQKFQRPRASQNPAESFCTDIVLSFSKDADGNLWIGSQREGICIRNAESGNYRQLRHDPSDPASLGADDVITILRDSQDRMWVGTDYGGLNLYQAETDSFERFLHNPDRPNSLSDNTVLSLLEDTSGMIWIGTFRGLNRLDPETGRFTPVDNTLHESLPSREARILSLHEDDQGRVWVGTHSSGIYRLDEALTAENYTSDSNSPVELSTNFILSISQHGDEYYIGTDAGLNRINLQEQAVTVYTTNDGLPNNTIYGILQDDDENLWLSTNNGLSKFSPESENFQNYTVYDGLQSREFNGGAYYRSNEGKLFFGGVNGFNEFNPATIPHNDLPPQLAFTSLEVNREIIPLPDSGEISLEYNQNFITIDFTSLDFTAPSNNLYRYRLAGLEDEWSEPDSERRARYTSLPPGSYTFEVMGSNSDRVWAEEPLILSIIISPPFWGTAWFQFLVFGLFVLILFSAYRYRVHHLLREERTRIQISRDLHDEVSSTLNSISFFAEAIQEKWLNKEETVRFLNLISRSSHEAKEKINDIVWVIRPEDDTWSNVLLRFKRFTGDLFDSKNINYTFHNSGTFPEKLNLNLKKNIWLIYREIITNIARHAEPSHVNIRFDYDHGYFILTVSDNGKGFVPEEVRQKGNGVQNIKSRVSELNGKFRLETAPGEGTIWTIRIHR